MPLSVILSAIPHKDQGIRLSAILSVILSAIPYRDHSRGHSRQSSRERRDIIHLTGLIDIMTIPRNTSITNIILIPRDMNFTGWRM